MSAHEGGKRKRTRFASLFLRGMAFFLLLILFAVIAEQGYAYGMRDRIARGVRITSIDVGGKTPEEAKRILEERIRAFQLTYRAKDALVTIPLKAHGGSAALYLNAAVDRAYAVGRNSSRIGSIIDRLRAATTGISLPMTINLDAPSLADDLRTQLREHFPEPLEAHLAVRIEDGVPRITVTKEQSGARFDVEAAVTVSQQRLRSLSEEVIHVKFDDVTPKLRSEDIYKLQDSIERTISLAPLKLTAKEHVWTVSPQLLASWLDAAPAKIGREATLVLKKDIVRTYLDSRAADLVTKPSNAIFQMKDGRVVEFIPSQDGETLDKEASITAIETTLFTPSAEKKDTAATATKIILPLMVVPPEISTAQANPYGIAEIIGVGESNFKGSPKNRRSNIAVGAASLDGVIIMPGEEFSLLKALGKIDESQGYLKELVIKDNKTIPEYGGGLCQIGTTTFRAALDTGVPITERRNHSYRVPYYERAGDGSYMGPGKDATIYDPAPDFKFMNDTGTAILIKTVLNKDRATFTFWGKKDGRKAEQTDARVYNETPPPEKKIIETTDLPPGETKCTEKPHAGASAVFTYTVTYPNGEEKKQNFYSHYRPWGEVCLLGIDPNAPKAPESPAALPSADAEGVSGN